MAADMAIEFAMMVDGSAVTRVTVRMVVTNPLLDTVSPPCAGFLLGRLNPSFANTQSLLCSNKNTLQHQGDFCMLFTPLPREFYQRDVIDVAQSLLGKQLIHVVSGIERRGRIVEVEAYLGPHDLAAHARAGLTPRTAALFGTPGHAYIYLIYGMYYCMNAVVGEGAGVLIRALEPIKNIEGKTSGPGLLCRAMDIDKRLYGHDLCSTAFYIAEHDQHTPRIVKRPRIGVDYAGHWARRLLRFYIHGNGFVSKP
jgi:DNA-3-methyladenine glycosylase